MRRGFYNGNKYRSSKVTFQGETFDSQYELERYLYLRDLQKHGKISGLRRQTKFVIITKTTALVPVQLKTKVKFVRKTIEQEADYHCDFLYKENGIYVIEEFKSEMTAKLADYILRRKLMVKKVHEHNEKGRGQWVFREVVYKGRKTTITDK